MCIFSGGGGQASAPPPPPAIPDYSAQQREQDSQRAQQTANANRSRMAMTQGPSSLINSKTGFNGVGGSGSNNFGSG